MTSDNYSVIIEGLDKVEYLALEDELTQTNLDLRVIDEDEQKYGEPGTIIAIAAIGTLVLPPLLVWLARHRRKFTVTEQEERELQDGTRITRTLTITATESGPPSAETLEKLAKFQNVPLKQLQDLFANADGQQ